MYVKSWLRTLHTVSETTFFFPQVMNYVLVVLVTATVNNSYSHYVSSHVLTDCSEVSTVSGDGDH